MLQFKRYTKLAMVIGLLLIGACSLMAQETAKVTIYRPKRFVGSGASPSIYCDERQMARLDNGRHVTFAISPGRHIFRSTFKYEPVTVELEAGKPLYLEMGFVPATWHGSAAQLLLVDETAAKAALAKLKPLDSKWIVATDLIPPGD